ncbi:MAG TPA: ankyrin repeat domain-containing protein [Pyrinomonadaceae bacterium]|nr:ankyrin repeat domain-containing protein [Pyrinomonadaceae bacterium]
MSEMDLIEAVKSGNSDSVRELVEAGAEVNQQDKQGWTPLSWAAGKGELEIVESLLQHGADPFLVGRDLRTPQMIAVAAGRAEVVKALRRAEAERQDGDAKQSERKFCSAFYVKELRGYSAWTENEIKAADANAPHQLSGDDVVFLHGDYSVTRSIWANEDVVFDKVTDQWKDFCKSELQFTIPDDLDLIGQPVSTS